MKDELYTVNYCPYCKKALAFFDDHNVEYINHDITENEEEMLKELGVKFHILGEVTVPQILLDDKHIGGYSDLIRLHDFGVLNI